MTHDGIGAAPCGQQSLLPLLPWQRPAVRSPLTSGRQPWVAPERQEPSARARWMPCGCPPESVKSAPQQACASPATDCGRQVTEKGARRHSRQACNGTPNQIMMSFVISNSSHI
jgi:hypothetical protein